MKNLYFIVVLVVIMLIGGFFYFQSTQTETTTEPIIFTDEQNNTFTIQYDDSRENAVLSLSGMQHDLVRAVSASGAKYESEDGSVVFWEKGGEARVEIDGEVMFEEAMTEKRRVEVLKSNKDGDPDANRYDFATEPCDSVDQDCTGGDDVSGVDITCGEGTILEGDVCVPERLDDDDDNDSLPVEDEASVGSDDGLLPKDVLTDNTWNWKETLYSDDTRIAPTDSSQFVATFAADGTFSSETDCNNTFGKYSIEGNSLALGPLASTRMYCEDSQETDYGKMLSEVQSYMITTEGNLVLVLKFDSGSMIFTPEATD